MGNAFNVRVPPGALVLLVGPPGAGKSTFVNTAGFRPDQIVCLDDLRQVVSGDVTNQDATGDAVRLAEMIVDARLRRRLTTVLDATNLRPDDRAHWAALADNYNRPRFAFRLDVSLGLCLERNRSRSRVVPDQVIEKMFARYRNTTGKVLTREGFTVAEFPDGNVTGLQILPDAGHSAEMDADHLTGPFDIIGDVHGCINSLHALRDKLGYTPDWDHPENRLPIFVGDPNDKGAHSVDVLREQVHLLMVGKALAVRSNHCDKLVRHFRTGKVKLSWGLDATVAQIEAAEDRDELVARIVDVYSTLPTHLLLDNGKLCVSHAGLPENLQGRWEPGRGKVMSFALYGDTTGKVDPDTGFPIRRDWAANYQGARKVVHGHVIIDTPTWRNGVLDIDTGCYEGGGLTALRWPENELVHVPTDPADIVEGY